MSTLTLVPSRDQDDSNHHYEEVKQLDDSSTSESNSSRSLSFGSPRRIGLAPLSLLATVLFWSFGMGSALLIYLLMNRVHPSHGSRSVPNLESGYLIVDEGNKTGSMKMLHGEETMESTMTGVLIITAISHFSSMAVAPLMGLGAFYVAAHWLNRQAQKKEGPTPLQLLLLIQMCSEGSWKSVLATFTYLFGRIRTKSPARADVSPLIYHTLIIASLVVMLHYGVVATDLWLSAELGSGYYSIQSKIDDEKVPVSAMLGTQNNASMIDWANSIAAYAPDEAIVPLMVQGGETVLGVSKHNYIAVVDTSTSSSIKDTSYMAVIVRPPGLIPSHWSWTAPTIGMGVECKPAPCTEIHTDKLDLVCPPPSEVPYKSIPLPSSNYIRNLTNFRKALRYASSGEILPDLIPSPKSQTQQANPLYYVINIQIPYTTPWVYGRNMEEFGDIMCLTLEEQESCPWLVSKSYYGACEVTLYDVEVSFNVTSDEGTDRGGPDSRYSFASPPIPMSHERAYQVLAPLFPIKGMINYMATDSLGAVLAKDTTYPGFSKRLSAEFSREMLAYLSGTNVTTVPPSSITSSSAKLFSRYPYVQTFAYIGVVYAHGVLAIIFFIGIVGKSSRTIVVGETHWRRNWRGDVVEEEQPAVQELLLVQSRLTDPLAVIAEQFLESDLEKGERPRSLTSAGTLSVQTDAVDMVEMERPDIQHVEIGLIDHRGGERWYGVKHRRDENILVTISGTGA
ncbi:hypothetical protein FRC02_010558 [Tulasnella sp. 418]|nr:hypothetical protein FRC02_010558 [Tulasnella sp. 418]